MCIRDSIPIVAVSPSAYTQRRLALVWGVETLLVPDFTATDTMLDVYKRQTTS